MSSFDGNQQELLRRLALGELAPDAPELVRAAERDPAFRSALAEQVALDQRLAAAARFEREVLAAADRHEPSPRAVEAADARLRALLAGTAGPTLRGPKRATSWSMWLAAAVVLVGLAWVLWPRPTPPERPRYLGALAPSDLAVTGTKPGWTLAWKCSHTDATFQVRVFDATAPEGPALAESATLTTPTWTPDAAQQSNFPPLVLWRVEARAGSERASSDLLWPR